MKDHTYNGVPIRKVPRDRVCELLVVPLDLADASEAAPPDWVYWVRMRLEIELLIRSLLGEIH